VIGKYEAGLWHRPQAQGAEQTHHDNEHLAAVRLADNPGAQS
jgi:hypothetical protein